MSACPSLSTAGIALGERGPAAHNLATLEKSQSGSNCSSTFVKDCVGCLNSDCLFRLVPHFIGTPTSPFALISMGFSQVSCYDRWLSCRAGHFLPKHV